MRSQEVVPLDVLFVRKRLLARIGQHFHHLLHRCAVDVQSQREVMPGTTVGTLLRPLIFFIRTVPLLGTVLSQIPTRAIDAHFVRDVVAAQVAHDAAACHRRRRSPDAAPPASADSN